MFKFISFQQIPDLKYCTLYGRKHITYNLTNLVRYYICYGNENCCDRGNGCCSVRSSKYYESWCFWICVFAIMLACYVLCWYCKKLEKERQAVRVNVGNDGNSAPRIMPCLRSVDANSVDHLLETLILNYRSRLLNQNQPIQNVDEIKVTDITEPPPEYTDALKMPKPQIDLDLSSISSNESMMESHVDNEPNNFVVVDVEDQPIPTYEEAIKKI